MKRTLKRELKACEIDTGEANVEVALGLGHYGVNEKR